MIVLNVSITRALAASEDTQPLFRGTIAVYPGCEDLEPWKGDHRVLILLGEADDIAPPGVCMSLGERLTYPWNVNVRSHADARYGFDVPKLPALLAVGDSLTLGFDSIAAANAWNEIEKFLRR